MLKLILNVSVALAIVSASAVILLLVVAHIHKRELESLRQRALRLIKVYERILRALICYAVGKPKPMWDNWIQLHALWSDYKHMENRVKRLLYPIPFHWLWGFIL